MFELYTKRLFGIMRLRNYFVHPVSDLAFGASNMVSLKFIIAADGING